jgi:hypothetical protein
MHSPRPSLNALRAFEAAARLGSVTAAATELAVSHSAVSHHIGSIEALFGIPLLRRFAHSVQPTEEGARLAGQLTQGFTLINVGIKLLQPAPLKISCSSTIMMHWLIPRLAAFKKANPKAEPTQSCTLDYAASPITPRSPHTRRLVEIKHAGDDTCERETRKTKVVGTAWILDDAADFGHRAVLARN